MDYYTKMNTNDAFFYRNELEITRHRILLCNLFADGESPTLRKAFARARFFFFTRGKSELIAVYCNGIFAHSSVIVPKCVKFPFLKKNEFEIGPCFTEIEFRGQGIYPYVLNWITTFYCEHARYYMFVDKNNKSSIRGIEKAGFKYDGEACEDFLKNYHIK